MSELVSIITPSYNCQIFITDTINSVLAQGYKNWEMIIVDDASTDDSVAMIEQFVKQDKRIKLVRLAKNGGAAMARNKALEYATGRYIAFLDSDDIWFEDKLELQVKFMQKHNHPISFTAYATIDENGQDLNHIIKVVNSLTLVQYLKNTIIGFSTSMIDKSQMANGIEFLNIRIRQDTNLWITLLKQGYTAYGLPKTLVKYRLHSNSISANKVKAAKQVWKLYFNIHQFGLFKSAYYFTFYAANAVKKRILG